MEFRVLGPIEVVQGRTLVDLGPKMLRALVAALLVHANRVVSVDQLVDALWGEEPPAGAVNALQDSGWPIPRRCSSSGSWPANSRPPGWSLWVPTGMARSETAIP